MDLYFIYLLLKVNKKIKFGGTSSKFNSIHWLYFLFELNRHAHLWIRNNLHQLLLCWNGVVSTGRPLGNEAWPNDSNTSVKNGRTGQRKSWSNNNHFGLFTLHKRRRFLSVWFSWSLIYFLLFPPSPLFHHFKVQTGGGESNIFNKSCFQERGKVH